MYLPQLTSGPSSVAWSPDSREVVYSMAGSLWRQKIDSKSAEQLTDGPGYDYQPDWSPDGRFIVYCTYWKDALELRLLDLESHQSKPLTETGAVNVEPRWSPDGKQIAFVSTQYSRRFHIFVASVSAGKLENVTRLTGETKSPLPRYYYSAFDTEISPAWSRDGREILFVSNRGHIYGSGGFWRMAVHAGAAAREIHYEETTWKARPEFSPGGERIVYSSYLGRSWHQLWEMPAEGGDVFPITYGDWDETNVRWSPDGRRLAFISNRDGNTALWLADVPGGMQEQLLAETRHTLKPVAHLHLRVRDAAGTPTAGRVSVTDSAGRFYAPTTAWIHADDGFDRAERPFEAHYFDTSGETDLEVPAGEIAVEVLKGFEHPILRKSLRLGEGESQNAEFTIQANTWSGLSRERWVSGDLHVHMNYAGMYRNTPEHLVQQAQAENLTIVNDLIVNKEQRFPDIAYQGIGVDPASKQDVLLVHGQEFHTSYWGHRGLLNLHGPVLLPGYAGYPNTAASSLFPMNAYVADMGRAREALVGAVHPFDEEPQPFAVPPQKITDELPVDVALGKIDYVEILGFSDHRATAAVWYRLLNLGFRLPAGAGTDAMANFASLRGPVGMNRVYVEVASNTLKLEEWMESLRKGRTFATNGPLLDFHLGDASIGGQLKVEKPQEQAPFQVAFRSMVPVQHLELVCNGRVAQSLAMNAAHDAAEVRGSVALKESGWCVVRAWSEKAEYPVLDNYVYATTSPIYVTVGGQKPKSKEDAEYFSKWIDGVEESTAAYPDWNTAEEKEYVLKRLREAKAIFESLR